MEVFMVKIMVLVVAVMLVAATGECEQKYNAFENRWETVPDNSDWQAKYNAFEKDWSYQPKDAKTQYNAFENQWDWDSGHNPDSDDNE
jgi:uncharacterized protein YpuA (DUF1002 family)